MANPITYGDLDRFLERKGFVVERRDATTVVYALPTTDIFFAFPSREPIRSVDPFHLWSVHKMLVERGIVDAKEFDDWEGRVKFGEPRGKQTHSAAPADGVVHGRRSLPVSNPTGGG